MRRATLILWLAALCISPCTRATDCQDLDLETLLEASAISPPGAVRFREERHSPLFREPLVLTGSFEYLEPGVLRKAVDAPFKENYLVNAGVITIESGNETRILPARQTQLIEAFLSGIEALLSGDPTGLERNYDHCLKGALTDWTLELQPKSRRLAKHLQGLQVRGGSGVIREFRVDLGEGEWQLVEILPLPDPGEG
jgi:hypothetical protein